MGNAPDGRASYYRRVLLNTLWLVVLGVWSLVLLIDDIAGKIVKPRVSDAAWKKLEWLTVIGAWPLYIWALGVLVILLIGATEVGYRLYREARKRGDKAIADFEYYKTGRLEVTWNPMEKPYRWWDETQNPPALYFRLLVRNVSGSTVNGVKVELSELAPRKLECVPCPIRLMNNILPGNTAVHSFSLNPGDKNFIDLMLQSRSLDCFWILHAVEGYDEVSVPRLPYTMTIRVSATDLPEIVRRYQLFEDGELWNMKELQN